MNENRGEAFPTARGDSGYDPEPVDEDAGLAQLGSDFARYFLALPESPLDEGWAPEPTFEDLLEEAETIPGADGVAARARREDPGPLTAMMLDALARRRLSATGLLDAACAAERLASWTQALQHRHLAAFARPGVCASRENLTEYATAPGQLLHPNSTGTERAQSSAADCSVASAAETDLSCSGAQVHGDPAITGALCLAAFKVAAAEVAAALRVSPIGANRRVSQAVDFTDELPATLTALQRGMIDRGRSLVIAERTQNLPRELRLRVEDVVVRKAVTRNAGQLRGIVDRAVIAADPAAAKKRQEAARRNRGVSLRAGQDGMSMFRADLPADKACTAFTVIDQIAIINSRRASEKRTINCLRADAFAGIFDQLADHGSVHLHTILGNGHTNVDPMRPCPNHAEHGSSVANLTNEAGVPTAARATDSAPPADYDTAGAGTDTDTGTAADECVHAANIDATNAAAADTRPATEAENSRTSQRLTAAALATRAAEHVPTAAFTQCGCHEMATPPAVQPVWGLGTHQGRATGLNVTIAATTLAGLDDLPGELDGHGAIPADLARALASSAATITAIAVNPTCGTALDLGRTVYRPRQAQRDFVNQRDQTCRFPSCRQPAWRCQLDHSDEFCPGKQDSGVTCPCNLACLCKFHHDLKTFGLWDTEHHADDSITFTSPTGRTYTTHTREWLTGLSDSATATAPMAAVAGSVGCSGPGSEVTDNDNDDPPF